MGSFAGDATTNLYKLFVDSSTRAMETGATSKSRKNPPPGRRRLRSRFLLP
ncbi:MAG TPA: hypothetical protein VF701_06635 [Thermoanaerobaculia bacterium]